MFDRNNTTVAETVQEKNDFQDLKKKRDEYAVEIRRQKREELLYKKRNRMFEGDQKLANGGSANNSHNLAEDRQLKESVDIWIKRNYDRADFLELVEAAGSNDRFKQHYGVIGIRKLLSTEQGPPIQAVIDANMVPRLVHFMQQETEPHLQLEAAWALTNVASGTSQQTQSIIDKGGIDCFITLLKSPKIEIAEQAIWAIGNIAGDSATFRDMILRRGAMRPLLELVSTSTNAAIVKNGTWAVSNLCRGKPLPDLKLVEAAIAVLSMVLQKESDHETLTDAAWALSYLTRNEDKLEELIETGVIPSLVAYLDHPHLALLIPCLRILGNIITGTAEQTNMVLQEIEFLPKLFRLVEHKKKAIRREACWTVSNITAGNADQIAVIMGNLEYFKLSKKAALSDIPEVQREAVWILSNATKNSNPEQIANMIEIGLLDCFISLLSAEDSKVVEITLEGINNVLNWGAIAASQHQLRDNEFLVVLENKGGVKKIEELQTHPNNEVYVKALRILENHFELENVL